MLGDKEMALDTLDMMKHSMTAAAKVCSESANQQLRQFLMQSLTETQSSQYQLWQLASQKGWYLAPGQADQDEINRVKQFYAQPAMAMR